VVTVARDFQLDFTMHRAHIFTGFTVAGITGFFTGRVMFGVTKMVFHLSFNGSFSKLFGQLAQQALFTHQIFRRFAVN
jgi:hypothetical protein